MLHLAQSRNSQLYRHLNCRYHGYVSAALVLGGVDITGPSLYMIHPHGSTAKLPFVTMGMFFHKLFHKSFINNIISQIFHTSFINYII